jgi:hypothetical protein
MNLYPIYGHIGFKFFCGFCAFTAFHHSSAHLVEKTQMNAKLERIANALERHNKIK